MFWHWSAFDTVYRRGAFYKHLLFWVPLNALSPLLLSLCNRWMLRLFQAAKGLGMLAILMIMKRNHSEFLPLKSVQKNLLTFEFVQFRMLNVYEWDIDRRTIHGSLSHMCNTHMVKWRLRGCVWGVYLMDTVMVRLHSISCFWGQALVLGLVQPLFIDVICLLCVILRWNDFTTYTIYL